MNVSCLVVQARPTAVIAETTHWEAYPELWPRLLDEVWSVVRAKRRDRARAVIDECERFGLERIGPRWEIYGHFNAPGDEEVEVYYLVR